MQSILVVCLFVLLSLWPVPGWAQGLEAGVQITFEATPIGRWKTVDDVTGRVTSVVVIWEEKGELSGRIERLVDPVPGDPDPRCSRCEGELKGRSLVGLRILWDLKRDGDRWSGGRILDPDNGRVYRCSVSVEDGGKKLRVRGFIGFSLLGRTQDWLREE